jgi:hypothetical protein
MSAFDIDAMLSVAGPDVDATISAVPVAVPSVFTWDYSSKPGSPLPRLFAKATAAQWRSEDLPWEIEVDPERLEIPATRLEIETGTVLDTWDEERWHAFAVESRRWMLSQFLHGEQGALLCTAKLVENVPGYDEKIFGASQVIDEARHVQVLSTRTFSRCSTTSSPTRAGISRTSGCRSWSRAWPWRRSGTCTR